MRCRLSGPNLKHTDARVTTDVVREYHLGKPWKLSRENAKIGHMQGHN